MAVRQKQGNSRKSHRFSFIAINKITVKNITDNCGYSTAAFHRHFEDKYDMIAWNCANGIRKIVDQAGSEGMDWRNTLLEGAKLFQKEKSYLANLLIHTSGHDSFIRYMTEINCAELMKYIPSFSEKGNRRNGYRTLVPRGLPGSTSKA